MWWKIHLEHGFPDHEVRWWNLDIPEGYCTAHLQRLPRCLRRVVQLTENQPNHGAEYEARGHRGPSGIR